MNVIKPGYRWRQRVSLICPSCKSEVNRLMTPLYCDACWYGIGGGDLARDDHFMYQPFAWMWAS